MPESVFSKKKRVRPPRVHITYEVELGGAQVVKELPFVVGVLSDLSGQPAESLAKLKDRKFVEIDRDNFDDVLKSTKPRLALRVPNTLKDDGSELSVELNFQKLSDFGPEAIVDQGCGCSGTSPAAGFPIVWLWLGLMGAVWWSRRSTRDR